LGGGFGSQTLYALASSTGEIEWRAQAPDGGPSAASVSDGKVLFNTESCTLFAVDARTGEQLWSRWLGDPLMSQPAVGGDRVFTGHIVDSRSDARLSHATRYAFTALALSSGEPIWSKPIDADVITAPVLDDRNVYFATMDGDLWSLDRAHG